MESAPVNSILVVDDNPSNVKVLFHILKNAGFKVSIARSGASALQMLEQITPDLILLDVLMPEMDGFTTCQQIKASSATSEIPVIFMTALADNDSKIKGFEVGAVDYITKPVHHKEVLARVGVHVQLRNLTKNLEQRVAERTFKLTQALEKLQQTQVKLVQAEKMSSLGQMVAGIAHQVNNPINFIHGNLSFAHQYIQDLLILLDLYHFHCPEPAPEIKAFSEKIELDYIKQDLLSLLSSMQVGTDRIQEIMGSLHTFSRLNEARRKLVDLHKGIDSTLMLLSSRLQANGLRPSIKVIKHYGNLPKVNCYGGQINQVFMNLLTNAIDAIDEGMGHPSCNQSTLANPQDVPTIHIDTNFLGNERVIISIADNGLGIATEVQTKVFDHFFSTKPVGKGTGLGLSISYEIVVEKHQGQLTYKSELGVGTEFVVELPIKYVSMPCAYPQQRVGSCLSLGKG